MAEKSVLSTIMQEPERFVPLATSAGLSESSFSTPALRLAWRYLIEDGHRYGSIDPAAFVQRRQLDGTLDALGGAAGVAEIFTYAPSPSGWSQWIELIKEAHALRSAQEAGRKLSEVETSAEAIAQTTAALEAIRKAAEGPRRSMTGDEAARAFMAGMEADFNAGTLPGLTTGFPELDAISGGIRAGELWVAAAQTSRGKTVLMNQISAETLTAGRRVAMFSLEMMAREVIARLVSVIGRIPLGSITQPRTATKRDLVMIREAAEKISASHLHLDASAGQTLESIRTEARRIKDAHGNLDLIVVDYIQICEGERIRNESREREVARISGGLKQLAKELDCPVLTASQLNETGQTRESRAIIQDSDALLYIAEDGIKIGKLRNGRRNDVLPLYLNGELQRFTYSKP